ncbi:MAG TPA: glucokinase [Hydrogenophaga sp.]|uniref:glucokinase n=1 Tax=Hydrogenophaga sp. TaxID=1904254 RepID=UPI002C6E5F9E|nr:glucokinase [Hydrogenophaga sp.]HMN93730.1 glucokinase [Hydrogenophaga sp.]HMP09153.1 glucokinase [Hydrogenophaga sp.]
MDSVKADGDDRSGRLLADVGGTHARFAWQAAAGAPLQHAQVMPVADHAGLEDAVWSYLAGLKRPVTEAAMAIATPVLGDVVSMTNHPWSFSQQALRQRFGWSRLLVINDFTALALALPLLGEADLRPVGGAVAAPGAPLALLGPGTGLGVSGLVPDGRGGWLALAGEGGHATWAALTPRELRVREGLSQRYGHVSVERVASGQGLVDVHAILCAADGLTPAGNLQPRDVTAAALVHGQPQALETLNLFAAVLGTVAGDLALTLGARGGVYLGGGILPRLGDWFVLHSPFRERFEAKGRYAGYLRDIPAWVITADPSPALLGASHALDAEPA